MASLQYEDLPKEDLFLQGSIRSYGSKILPFRVHINCKSSMPHPGLRELAGRSIPFAQSTETWPIGMQLVCRQLRPVSLEDGILVTERVV